MRKDYNKIYESATKQVILEEKVDNNLTEEMVLDFIQTKEFKMLMKEASEITSHQGKEVDDGPGFLFGNFKSYKKVSDEVAKMCGCTVTNYIMSDPGEPFLKLNTSYPDGSGEYPVSWYPSGISKEKITDTQKNKWLNHIDRVIKATGYAFIDFVKEKELK